MPHNLKKTLKEFKINGGQTGKFHSLPQLGKELGVAIERLPVSIRIVLESLVRFYDGKRVTEEHVRNLAAWQPNGKRTAEIPFIVVRIVLQDLIGFGALTPNIRRAIAAAVPSVEPSSITSNSKSRSV